MSAPRKCTECGAKISEGQAACPDCGFPVEGAVAPTPPPAPGEQAAAPRSEPRRRDAKAAPTAQAGTRTMQAGIVGAVVGAALMFGALQMIKSLQPAPKAAAEETQAENGRMPAGEMPPGMPPGGGAPALPEDMHQKIAMLKQMVDKSPDNFMHIVGLANLMYDAGQFKDAIPYYQKAVKLEPDSLNVRVDLATSMFQAGEGHEALGELRKVLQKDAHHPNAMYNLGVIEKSLGHQGEADKAWRDYVEHFPDGPKSARLKADLASGATRAADYKP
jgi:cytochrome c-type biogenesis protein CcmH/NrfG